MKQNGETEIESEAWPDLIQYTSRLLNHFSFLIFDIHKISTFVVEIFLCSHQLRKSPVSLRGGHAF